MILVLAVYLYSSSNAYKCRVQVGEEKVDGVEGGGGMCAVRGYT